MDGVLAAKRDGWRAGADAVVVYDAGALRMVTGEAGAEDTVRIVDMGAAVARQAGRKQRLRTVAAANGAKGAVGAGCDAARMRHEGRWEEAERSMRRDAELVLSLAMRPDIRVPGGGTTDGASVRHIMRSACDAEEAQEAAERHETAAAGQADGQGHGAGAGAADGGAPDEEVEQEGAHRLSGGSTVTVEATGIGTPAEGVERSEDESENDSDSCDGAAAKRKKGVQRQVAGTGAEAPQQQQRAGKRKDRGDGSSEAHGANAKIIAEHQRHAGENAERASSSREQSGEKGGSAHGAGGKRKEAACTGISGEHEGGIHSTPVQRCEHTETPGGTEARPSRKRAVRSYTEAPRRQEKKPRWRG